MHVTSMVKTPFAGSDHNSDDETMADDELIIDLFDDETEANLDAAEAEHDYAELLLQRRHAAPIIFPSLEAADNQVKDDHSDDKDFEATTPSESSDDSSDEELNTLPQKRRKKQVPGELKSKKRQRADPVPDISTTSLPPSHQYLGTGCSCTKDKHVHDSTLPEGSSLHLSTACNIMTSLNLTFHKRWRYVICCEAFVPLKLLRGHFVAKHQHLLPTGHGNKLDGTNKLFSVVEEHLSIVLDIPKSQTRRKIRNDFTLSTSIAGIAPAIQCFQCPDAACRGLYLNPPTLRVHYSGECGKKPGGQKGFTKAEAEQCGPFWAQPAFGSVKNGPRIRVLDDPSSSTSSAPSETPQVGRAAPLPQRYTAKGKMSRDPWAIAAGWVEWLDRKKQQGWSVPTLVSLCAPPKHMAIPPVKPSRRETFAWAGNRILARLTLMASDANMWLDSTNPELRVKICIEYVQFKVNLHCRC